MPPAQRTNTSTRRRPVRRVQPQRAHLIWRRAQEDATCAYEAWRSVDVEERAMAFAGYLAALDREAAAAADLERAGGSS